MKIGLIHSSKKRNERRYPVHIKHLKQLKPHQLQQIIFEEGYPGLESFDTQLLNISSREEVFNLADLLILPKPVRNDYPLFKNEQIIWGWPHSVQTPGIVDVAIKKKLTLIAWENMFDWHDNEKGAHVFHRNNELAGYASVIHGLTLAGMTAGSYGSDKKVAVIGYGSTGKGAIKALMGLGAEQISVYSRRSHSQIKTDNPRLTFKKYQVIDGLVMMEGNPAFEELRQYDIIVNCILQNPLKPKNFLSRKEALMIDHRFMIIDVSCDEGMGFEFARPTSFDKPVFHVGKVVYYGVNHSPSYFYEAASFEISKALFPYLRHILNYNTYLGNKVLEKAVDIAHGIIKKPEILTFQNRNRQWPHNRKRESKKEK